MIGAVSFVQTPGPEKTVNVGYATRTYILGPDGTLYRLASAKFSRMVDDPESHRLERFAGQRVRMAEAIVEVRDRAPCAVVRLIYEVLGFDAEGRLDRATFIRQNAALAELAMSRVIPRLEAERTDVVDAGSRFVARGGSWQPSAALERKILRAALDETTCKQL
ncbi:MAG: hypothetical protein WAM94_04005 [Chromatiaceae bacterium]